MEIKYTLEGSESVSLCFSRLCDIIDILDDNRSELEYVDHIKNNINIENKDIDNFIEFIKVKYEDKKRYILMEILQELRMSIIFTEPFREMWLQSGSNLSTPWRVIK